MRPSKPSSRSASAAFAPARPAPTITWVSALMSGPPGERQELLPCPWVVAHQSAQRRGDRLRARLLHAAQGHAEVLGLEHDADALGLELLFQPARDLGRQPLLELKR